MRVIISTRRVVLDYPTRCGNNDLGFWYLSKTCRQKMFVCACQPLFRPYGKEKHKLSALIKKYKSAQRFYLCSFGTGIYLFSPRAHRKGVRELRVKIYYTHSPDDTFVYICGAEKHTLCSSSTFQLRDDSDSYGPL
jgi:hypothetical protein